MALSKELQEKLQQLPLQTGVYQFFDEHGRLLYIGKATHLRSRVRSYFRSSTQLSGAKQFMVHQIDRVTVTVVDTPTEALLLETTLIKKYKPPYNVVMKDDKHFQFIHITDDAFPAIETVRRLPLSHRRGHYYGPYTSGYAVRRTLHLLKSIFHYCETPPVEKRGVAVFPKRPCLDYHLGRCLGPCAGDVTAEGYQRVIAHIEHFLRGDYQPIRRRVERDMQQASKHQQFELAARLRDTLQSIDSLMEQQKVVSTTTVHADYLSLVHNGSTAAVNLFVVRGGKLIHQEVFFLGHTEQQSDDDVVDAFEDQYYSQATHRPRLVYRSTEPRRGKHRRLLEMGMTNAREALERQQQNIQQRAATATTALQQLAEALGLHGRSLRRIEVYDISNVQGKYSVGSMVVFINGQSAPQEYRKFKIKTVDGPNDFASIREVMNRRVRHLTRDHAKSSRSTIDRDQTSQHTPMPIRDPWPRPDLIIIDGGKGQLSSAHAILSAAHIDIPLCSLAKQEEELFLPGQSISIRLPKGTAGYHLVQRMRDEAHRFAIGFYRSRHMKGLLGE